MSLLLFRLLMIGPTLDEILGRKHWRIPALLYHSGLVGFSAATFSWESLFSTDSSSLVKTFTIENGVAHGATAISHPSPSSDGFGN
jgi:hypothetical protein